MLLRVFFIAESDAEAECFFVFFITGSAVKTECFFVFFIVGSAAKAVRPRSFQRKIRPKLLLC